MQDQGQNVLKAECKVSLPAVLVPREAQGARPSENARDLLLHGVLKGASVHRYLTFALLRDASSPVVRRRLICVCAYSGAEDITQGLIFGGHVYMSHSTWKSTCKERRF